jgi:hypothetical protein
MPWCVDCIRRGVYSYATRTHRILKKMVIV